MGKRLRPRPGALPWVDPEGRPRAEEAAGAALVARRAALSVGALPQLEALAAERDARLRERLELLGLHQRWERVLALGESASELVRLDADLCNSVSTGEGPGVISRAAFMGLVRGSVKGAPLSALASVFEAFSAWQYYRQGIAVHSLDTLDARELVVACRLMLGAGNVKSAVDRLTHELFSVVGPQHVGKEECLMLLTVGIQDRAALQHVRSRFEQVWPDIVPLADRARLRVSRADMRVLLQQGLPELFDTCAVARMAATGAARAHDRIEEAAPMPLLRLKRRSHKPPGPLEHEPGGQAEPAPPAEPAPGPVRLDKRFTPAVLCAWEAHCLPVALSSRLLAARQAARTEEAFLRASARRRAGRLGRAMSTWREAADRASAARAHARAMLEHIARSRSAQAFRRLVRHALEDVAARRLHKFGRLAIRTARSRHAALRREAATQAQAVARGFLARRAFARHVAAREPAARLVQRFYRARKLAYETKLQRYRDLQREWASRVEWAAVRIQCAFRRRLAFHKAVSRRNLRDFERRQLYEQRAALARHFALQDEQLQRQQREQETERRRQHELELRQRLQREEDEAQKRRRQLLETAAAAAAQAAAQGHLVTRRRDPTDGSKHA
jgi:hypothetical protein